MMLIGYASKKLQKICTKEKDAKKALPEEAATQIFRRLADLEAFNNLSEIPFQAPPLRFHPLREDRTGQFGITIHGLQRVCFRPVGGFSTDEEGNVVLASVTCVEITFVGNYHSYG